MAFLNKMLERNKSIYKKTAYAYYRGSVMPVLAGLVFIGFSFISEFTEFTPLALFFRVMGALFVLSGILNIINGRKIVGK